MKWVSRFKVIDLTREVGKSVHDEAIEILKIDRKWSSKLHYCTISSCSMSLDLLCSAPFQSALFV